MEFLQRRIVLHECSAISSELIRSICGSSRSSPVRRADLAVIFSITCVAEVTHDESDFSSQDVTAGCCTSCPETTQNGGSQRIFCGTEVAS